MVVLAIHKGDMYRCSTKRVGGGQPAETTANDYHARSGHRGHRQSIQANMLTAKRTTNQTNTQAAPSPVLFPRVWRAASRAVATAFAGIGVPAASSSVPRGAAAGSGASTLSPVRPRSISDRN